MSSASNNDAWQWKPVHTWFLSIWLHVIVVAITVVVCGKKLDKKNSEPPKAHTQSQTQSSAQAAATNTALNTAMEAQLASTQSISKSNSGKGNNTQTQGGDEAFYMNEGEITTEPVKDSQGYRPKDSNARNSPFARFLANKKSTPSKNVSESNKHRKTQRPAVAIEDLVKQNAANREPTVQTHEESPQ